MKRKAGTGRLARLGEFGTEIRWTVVVVVAAVLLAVALWPRESGDPEASGPGDGRPGVAAPSARRSESVDPARLAELRQQAALQACAGSGGSQGAGGGPLAGASGTCMANGEPVDLATATAGQATLINVWASWCAPCREELPALQRYARQPGSAQVLGVQVQSGPAAGLQLLEQLGVHFPNVHDTDRRISEALRVPRVIPASYVLTPTGDLRRLPPEVFNSADEVRRAVDNAMEGAR